ncbi:retrovirus-related pol polyprotein from transposon TNT 1-94 [Tanacetum coccineum]
MLVLLSLKLILLPMKLGGIGPYHASEVTASRGTKKFDLGNIPQSYAVPTTPNTRIHKDNPIDHVIGDVAEEPKRVSKALSDPAWVEAMQEELLQFKLQKVQQKKKGIFISQDKYVHEILRKFNYIDVKSASTPIDLEKPLVQDGDVAEVDEHLYRSMIGSLMYLIASRPDIMFTDSLLELVAYTDSDYAGATQDRKSTTGVILMASLDFCDKHNMVAFLEKSTGSAGFHQIIDFLNQSHISYALTKKPEVCVSFIKQFWRSAEASNDENGEVKINATIDGHSLSITEGSLRRHLKLADQDGITSIPTTEIFEQLALMGYQTDSDKLTFQKGAFSPQWRFLIHNILHCLSPKKTAWEQFSSNIATAVILFSFPLRNMQRNQLQPHTRTYHVPSLSNKVFNNMKRPTKGYSGQEVALFPNLLDGRILSEPMFKRKQIKETEYSGLRLAVTPKERSSRQQSSEKGSAEVSTVEA